MAFTSNAWLIRGDFNIVRSASKRLKGNLIDFSVACKFNDFISQCGLTEFSC